MKKTSLTNLPSFRLPGYYSMLHEQKNCPRCNASFECNPGNITQCQCYGFKMSNELKVYIEQRYNDCLCRNCLDYLSQELNLFKEKYIFR